MSDPRSAGDEPDRAPEPLPSGRLRRYTTGRVRVGMLAALAFVLLMVFLAAPTTKIYLDQRAEIAQLEASIQEKTETRDALREELDLWENPEYVKQQAGERLMMVEPGQRSYLVVGADEVGEQAPSSSALGEEARSPAWADALWGSVKDSAWPERRARSDAAQSFPGEEQQDPATDPAPSDDATTTDPASTADAP